MKLNNESLQDFDAILKECLEKAQNQTKRKRISEEHLLDEIASGMRVELERRKSKISQVLCDVDLAMNHGADSVQKRELYHLLRTQHKPKRLTDSELTRNFVQKEASWYKVWDNQIHQWRTFSDASQIDVRLDRAGDGTTPVISVKAFDPKNGTRLQYTNNALLGAEQFNPADYGYGPNKQHHMSFTDKAYNSMAYSNGAIGTTAGTLEAFFQGTSQYDDGLTILNKKFIDGKWQSAGGEWHNFRQLEQEANGFKKQSLKVSKHWAQQRSGNALKYGRVANIAGKVCFGISIYFARENILDAKNSDDSNKNAVYLRNGLDVVMGVVAFIPVWGWAVSGTYFLLMSETELGDLGQMSGFTTAEAQAMHNRRQEFATKKLTNVILEFDIEPSDKEKQVEIYEQQRKVQDNTYVAPRTLFKTDFR